MASCLVQGNCCSAKGTDTASRVRDFTPDCRDAFVAFLATIDVNKRDSDGFAPLHHAARSARSTPEQPSPIGEELFRLILSRPGAQVDVKDATGSTALMLLVSSHLNKENFGMLQSLVEKHRADVNAQNNEGHTALMIACAGGMVRNVEYLLTHGARLDIKDKCAPVSPFGCVVLSSVVVLVLVVRSDRSALALSDDRHLSILPPLEPHIRGTEHDHDTVRRMVLVAFSKAGTPIACA